MSLYTKLDALHFNHGDKVRYRMRITAGLLLGALMTHAATAWGMELGGIAACYVNLAVSFIWVWE